MKWNDYQKECERLAKEAIKKSMDTDGWLDDIEAIYLLPSIVKESWILALYGNSWDLCDLVYKADSHSFFEADNEVRHSYESKCILQVTSAIAEHLLFTKAQEELEILIDAYNDRRVSKESFAEILEGYAL
jgi:hypothetical protein